MKGEKISETFIYEYLTFFKIVQTGAFIVSIRRHPME